MSKPNFDDFLASELENKQQEMEPGKDLWSGIDRALVKPEVTQKARLNAKAMGAIAASTIAALVGIQLYTKAPSDSDTFANMTRYFEKQKQGLLVQYQSQPALTDNWQQQLAELEQAEKAIKQALENEPQNPALLKMLAQVYQQQLDLINKVHQPAWQTI